MGQEARTTLRFDGRILEGVALEGESKVSEELTSVRFVIPVALRKRKK